VLNKEFTMKGINSLQLSPSNAFQKIPQVVIAQVIMVKIGVNKDKLADFQC